MRVDLFDFELPDELIALRPARPRESARLLHVRDDGRFEDLFVSGAPALFREGDVLIFNDTRVIPAALKAVRPSRDPQGPIVRVSLNLIERLGADTWRALARPGKRLKQGDVLEFVRNAPLPLEGGGAGVGVKTSVEVTTSEGECGPQVEAPPHPLTPSPSRGGGTPLSAAISYKYENGDLVLRFDRSGEALDAAIAKIGQMPLPPYIAAKRPPDEADLNDYQTFFAQEAGAVAAPTAGLHFTHELFDRLLARGLFCMRVTLHVGAGTFLPVKADDTAEHVMHSEWRSIPEGVASEINRAKAEGRRVIAIGTTALRTLESSANEDGSVRAEAGPTDIFITPGYRFKVVDGLWTNFHLPRSTLFMLVSAFSGLDRMKGAYAHAIAQKYRFYSYGDASLLWRAE